MGQKMQLTSVKVPEDLFEQFKIACVNYSQPIRHTIYRKYLKTVT
jgi:hypothetical protein